MENPPNEAEAIQREIDYERSQPSNFHVFEGTPSKSNVVFRPYFEISKGADMGPSSVHQTWSSLPRNEIRENKSGSRINFDPFFGVIHLKNRFALWLHIILCLQDSVMTGSMCFFIYYRRIKPFLYGIPAILIATAVFFLLIIILYFAGSIKRRVPFNTLFLILIPNNPFLQEQTFSLSYSMAAISTYHKTYVILVWITIMFTISLVMVFFSIQNKCEVTDFKINVPILGVILLLYILVVTTIHYTYKQLEAVSLTCSALLALTNCAYIFMETKQFSSGKKYNLKPHEYICGSICLYIDIIYYICAIFKRNKR